LLSQKPKPEMISSLRKLARPWAIVFILANLLNVLAPTISWALTSGPTAPEYTGFTNWNSIDNVNLFTGDFTYNLPLLEVKDSGGDVGYPLSISYDAGVKTNQESSWVGLGFNLNVGAINRSVSGIPDDYLKAPYSVHDTWEGGNQYKEGFGIPITGLGLWVETNWSTHSPSKLYDFAASLGPFAVDTRDRSVGINFNFSQKVSEGGKRAFELNFSPRLMVEIGKNSSGNVGITSNGFTSSTYSPHSNKADKVSTQTVEENNYIFYEYKKTRYWIDETDSSFVTGSLNGFHLQYPVESNHGFDKHISGEIIANVDLDNNPRIVRNNNELMAGPSFPDYDNYIVTANGMSGSIQPLLLENSSLFDRQKNNMSTNSGRLFNLKYNILKNFSKRPGFRFLNDFSNSFRAQNVENFNLDKNPLLVKLDFANHPLGYTPLLTDDKGFNMEKLLVAGSSHIDYYENQETDNSAGFIKHARGNQGNFLHGKNVSNQIGGFSITRSDGKTYHYSLPVYAYNETRVFTKYDRQNKKTEREIKNTQPYAYTWLLTAITGSDFVDRNNNKIPDESDWGEWTSFVYGAWSESFSYRSPGEGTLKEIDGSEVYSYGQKQLYYLDAVYSRTNTALFVKSIRKDAKSVTSLTNGGYDPIGADYPQSSLALDKIIYCKNIDLKNYGNSVIESLNTLGNVFNKVDITNKSGIITLNNYDVWKNDLKNKCERAIKFNYDYSLCPNTPNSYLVYFENFVGHTGPKEGKLTLKSIEFFGKGESELTPPVTFDYSGSPNPQYQKDAYDVWGFYKSDYTASKNELARLPSSSNAMDATAWSLTRIGLPLGSNIDIEYKPKYYDDVVLGNQRILNVLPKTGFIFDNSPIEYVTQNHPNDYLGGHAKFIKLYIREPDVSKILQSSLRVGDFVEITSLASYYNNQILLNDKPVSGFLRVEELGSNYVKVTDPNRVFINYENQSSRHIHYFSFIKIPNTDTFGGGVRASSITFSDLSTEFKSKLQYEFSEGLTSYEPIGFELLHSNVDSKEMTESIPSPSNVEIFRRAYFKIFDRLVHILPELPSPAVNYGKCVLRNFINSNETESYEEYSFSQFTNNSIYPDPVENYSYNIIEDNGGSHESRTLKIKDFTSQIGQLISHKRFDINNRLIYSKINEYSSDASLYSHQGRLEEVHHEHRIIDVLDGGADINFATVSIRSRYPSIPVQTTSMDVKGNITEFNRNLKFDFYTGEPTSVLSEDGHGNTYVVETVPAYSIPVYSGMTEPQVTSGFSGMGLKVRNPKNKNMLTQSAANYSYKVNSDYKTNPVDANKLALVSASAQTWSDETYVLGADNLKQAGIWRQKSSFRFIGGDQNVSLAANSDGLQPMTSFAPYSNWSSHQEQTGWEKNAEITLYDYFSHALEAFDINGKYAATIMSQDQTRVIGTAANAQYDQIGYSGAEEQPKIGSFISQYELGNNIFLATSNGATWVQEKAHTGVTSLRAAPGQQAFLFSTGNSQCNTYRASVWSSQPDGKIKYHVDGGAAQTPVVKNTGKAGDWYLLEADISGVSGYDNVRIWCEGGSSSQTYFDDFRIHPYQAAMTSYVYNNWGELTHILDNNNLYTEYKYDEMGRLKETYKESFQAGYGNQGVVKVSEFKINYGVLNPMMTSITATSVGATGSVTPVGNTSVELGKDKSFNFIEYCSGSFLEKIFIDNKQVPYYFSTPSNLTLYDGTEVNITGKTVAFKKIKSPHTLRGEFYEYPNNGFVRCEVFVNSNGTYCNTGRFVYGDLDACGLEINVQLAASRSEIPAWLLPLAPDSCPLSNSQECTGLQN
jgi:hypothetical protein